MTKKIAHTSCILFICFVSLAFAQQEKDTTIIRLEKELKEVQIDTVKADILFNIGARLFGRNNVRAKNLLNEAADLLPDASHNHSLRGQVYQYLAAINNDQGNYPIALDYLPKLLE